MVNLPNSLSMNAPFGGPGSNPGAAGAPTGKERRLASAEHLVLELSNKDLRENALLELSKKRELFKDLAPLLWNSFGTIAALLQVDDTEVISFLLSTEIIPLCLHTMEMGSELSKTVATFIVQKILLDDVGLDYICTTAERFFAVGRVLGNMVTTLSEQPSPRLLKHIIRCYLRLSDNLKACDALRSCLPERLRDATFNSCLREDPTTRRWLQQLLHNVGVNRVPT
ncbi:unnamed protein product [Linum tenue]|uniref:Uncharacterized protein n=1 Tax=Linum tenue TaxID=586396 RepID=A0AAV0H4H0_9ROSI|nr:unnamed protein product [Linum tenue]